MNTLQSKPSTVKELVFYLIGGLLIAGFVILYFPRFAAIRIVPPVIWYLLDHLGRTWAIAANVGVFILFLLFLPYRTKIEWRSKSTFSAFILALIAEMFGIPLLVFILSPLIHISYYETYVGGWLNNPRIFGWTGAVIGAWLTLLGMILVVIGWHQIHRAKGLVTTGIYKYIRHPQYTGFFLIITGWILHWETTLTLLMYPVLTIMYFLLARREDMELKNGFGAEYEIYRKSTPMFFPKLKSVLIKNDTMSKIMTKSENE
jgi:protein-S-isoprenylcysteine O-methyltransferase Ste14